MNFFSNVLNSIPVVGHVKGGIHYLAGDAEGGHRAMYQSTRTSAVMAGGAAGLVLGPAGAAVGAVYGSMATDLLASGLSGKPQGLVENCENVGKDIAAGRNPAGSLASTGFQIALDGLGGLGMGGVSSAATQISEKAVANSIQNVGKKVVSAVGEEVLEKTFQVSAKEVTKAIGKKASEKVVRQVIQQTAMAAEVALVSTHVAKTASKQTDQDEEDERREEERIERERRERDRREREQREREERERREREERERRANEERERRERQERERRASEERERRERQERERRANEERERRERQERERRATEERERHERQERERRANEERERREQLERERRATEERERHERQERERRVNEERERREQQERERRANEERERHERQESERRANEERGEGECERQTDQHGSQRNNFSQTSQGKKNNNNKSTGKQQTAKSTNTTNQQAESQATSSGSSQPPQGNRNNNNTNKKKKKTDQEVLDEFLQLLATLLRNIYGTDKETISAMFSKSKLAKHGTNLIKVLRTLENFDTLETVLETVIKIFKDHISIKEIRFENFLSLLEFVRSYLNEKIDEVQTESTLYTEGSYDERRALILRDIRSEEGLLVNGIVPLFDQLKTEIQLECMAPNNISPDFRDLFAKVYHYYKHRRIPELPDYNQENIQVPDDVIEFIPENGIFSVRQYFYWVRKLLEKLRNKPRYKAEVETQPPPITCVYNIYIELFGHRFRVVVKVRSKRRGVTVRVTSTVFIDDRDYDGDAENGYEDLDIQKK